jgi:uncharacterized cupredoxin-like copper-binding protein
MQISRTLKTLGVGGLVLATAVGLALAHGAHKTGSHSAKAAYGEPGDPKKPARDVVVVMAEGDGRMLFEPSTIVVKKGEQVRFKFRNEGALEHEFLLGTQAELDEHADIMKAAPDMKHDEPNAVHLAPKAAGDLVWRFTNAGEFPFACLIRGHREAGMIGKIVVR